MSQNPYAHIGSEPGGQFPYGPDFAPTRPESTSITAIIALVFAICGCVCPIFVIPGPIAMAIGGLAILLIAMTGWRKRGIGIAITAICLGLLQCVIVALFFFGIYQPVMGGWRSVVVGPLGQVLANIDKGDAAAARSALTPHAQGLISEEALADFGKRYNARLGKFDEFSSNPWEVWKMYGRVTPAFKAMDDGTGQPMQNVVPIPGKFEKGEALVMMQLDQGQMQKRKSRTNSGSGTSTTTGTAPSPPPPNPTGQWQMPVLNIGIATVDGKVEWLIDPDLARQGGRPPPGPGGPPGSAPGGPPGPGAARPPIMGSHQLDAETGAIRMVNHLPFNLILQRDILQDLWINEERGITGGGPSKFAKADQATFGTDRTLQVRRFAIAEGKTLVQVRMDPSNARFGLASDIADGIDLGKPLTIIDNHDKATPAVGFVSRIGADTWVSYHPDTPLTSMRGEGIPPISRDKPAGDLVMLFQIDTGSKITEIRIGDRTLVKFDPPLEAKENRP